MKTTYALTGLMLMGFILWAMPLSLAEGEQLMFAPIHRQDPKMTYSVIERRTGSMAQVRDAATPSKPETLEKSRQSIRFLTGIPSIYLRKFRIPSHPFLVSQRLSRLKSVMA
jgi:hypothetical protein